MDASLAVSSRIAYQPGWRHYLRYCDSFGVPQWTPGPEQLAGFVAYLTLPTARCPLGITVSTLHVYIAAVKFHFRATGRDDPFKSPALALLLRGYRRTRGHDPKPRRPITMSLLRLMGALIDRDTLTGATLWAALCVGVNGCFRSGELFPATPLTWSRVTAHTGRECYLTLERTKTVQFREVKRRFLETLDETCPVRALRALRSAQARAFGRETTSVFAHADGRPWSRTHFISAMRDAVDNLHAHRPDLGLDSDEFAGHSMRRGGATSLAIRGVPAWAIRGIGAWSSDCFMRYIEIANEYLREFADKLRASDDGFSRSELDASRSRSVADAWKAWIDSVWDPDVSLAEAEELRRACGPNVSALRPEYEASSLLEEQYPPVTGSGLQ